MPIVQSSHSSPSKLNGALPPNGDLMSKPIEEVIEILNWMISEHFFPMESCSEKEISESQFYLKRKPSISLIDFLKRIMKFTDLTNEVLFLAYMYMEKVINKNLFNFQRLNYHKLMFISLIMAFKYQEDDIYTNNYYARVGGIKVDELFNLEVEFLEMLDFNLYIDEITFTDKAIQIGQHYHHYERKI